MKTVRCMIGLVLMVAGAAGFAQDMKAKTGTPAEVYRWSAGIELGGGTGGGKGMFSLGAVLGRSVASWLDLGVSLQAFGETNETYTDGSGRTYHRETGYAALLVRPKIQLSSRIQLAFPIETGSGILLYKYDSKYASELRWTDETLDQVSYGLYSGGLEARVDLGTRFALSITGGYRGTTPLRTDLAAADELTGPWGRLGFVYHF